MPKLDILFRACSGVIRRYQKGLVGASLMLKV